MQLTFRYSLKELITGLFFSMPRSYVGKSIAIISFAFFLFVQFGENSDIILVIGYSIIKALIFTTLSLCFVILLLILPKTSRSDRTVTIGDEGMEIEYPHQKIKIKWNEIKRIHLGNYLIYLKVKNGFHMAIPRRVFTSKISEEEFLVNIERNIGTPKE